MNSESATYSGFEFESDGYPALAIINTDLKNIERAKYPYSVFITIIPDTYNEFGHPEEEEYDYLNDLEKKMMSYLESETETVHVGHTTVYRAREIIFYTKDRELVESFLNYFLPETEREHSFDIEQDEEWNNVSGFYELL
jgi:hypothetical protein